VRGDEYPDVLLTMGSLGILYRDEGKYDQANALFTKVLEISPRATGCKNLEKQLRRFQIIRNWLGATSNPF